MIRRTIQYCLLLALLSGCSKEYSRTIDGADGALSFNLTVDGMLPVESCAVSDMPDFNTHGFDIAGYGTTNRFEENVIDSPTAKLPTPNLFGLNIDMIAVPHIDKQPDGSFRSPLSKIPLLEGTYLSFFAWSQNKLRDKVSGIVESTDDETDKGFPYLKILVPDAPQSQFDIVAARSTNHENDYVISAVDLDFNHILSKLTFRATSSTRNQVKIESVKINYGANKVYRGGTFTFASSGVLLGSYGSYNSYHSGQHSLGTSFVDISNGSTSALGDMLLMPQKLADDFASIDITYRITLFDKAEQQVTKSVPIKAITLEYGKNYLFTLNITATEILMSVGSIGNWIDGDNSPSLPMIAGPRGDVMLLLDGKDAPYTQGNKKYWLDRSGYNRHCEIIGNVTYNSADKAYVFNNSDKNYVLAPPLGNLTAATIQLVTAVNGSGVQNAFFFSDQDISRGRRILFTHLPYNNSGTIYFDAGQTSGYDRISTTAVNTAQLQAYSLYTYRKGGTFMAFSRNDNYHLTANDKSTNVGTINYNYIGYNFGGNVKYFKLTQRSISSAEVSIDYADIKQRYNLPDEPSTPVDLIPPVRDNLILCLDARSGKETVDGKTVWRDQSPAGNHAQILSNNITWTGTSFNFPGQNATDKMRLAETFNMNNFWWLPGGGGAGNFTIEIVVKPVDRGNNWVLDFSRYTPETPDDALKVGTRIRLPNGNNQVFWGTADYGEAVNGAYANGIMNISTLKQYSFRRNTSLPLNDGFMVIRQNNAAIGEYARTWVVQAIKYMDTNCYIGGDIGFNDNNAPTNNLYQGEIMAIRIYARPLTDEELKKNWEHDKAAHNIPE